MREKNMKLNPINFFAVVFSLFFANISLAADSDLIVFDWGGYEDPGFFGAYVEKYGDSPTYSFFSDEEEAFQKVRAGFRADLGHPCSQSVVKWRNAEIIVPIDTSRLKTFAKKMNNGYLVNGQKIWTSTAKIADKILLLARTSPIEECKKNTDGLTLFYTNLDREKIEVREISKMGRAAVDSNQIFIDNLEVPEFDRIGEEGKGFKYILDSLNPERILIAAEALGIGKNALSRAVKYANDRVVFNRPIGKNQSIQHPLAENWIELEAAELLIAKAAYQYDKGENAGGMANAAKYFAAEAGFKAATQAVVTLGGMGYAKEYHVERLLRESLIPKLAPVSAQMILNYISERVLGLPKSY